MDGLQRALERELDAHPFGLPEQRLLSRLRVLGLPGFVEAPDPEVLFDQHFRLFHALYRLRLRWRGEARRDLQIHCLGIRAFAYRNPRTRLPATVDPVEAYYLDAGNVADRSRARAMIGDFWQRMAARDVRAQALAQLGLSDPVAPAAVRRRYLRLARQTHPDLGGDAGAFGRIANAYANLSQSDRG